MKLNKSHNLYQEDLKFILSTKGIESLKGKSILITGATGLIGLNLIDALMLMGEVKVYAVGRSKEKALDRLGEYYSNPDFTFIEQDVQVPFDDNIVVDYIISGASNTHPLAYSKFPVETIMINVKGTENVLNLARRCSAAVILLSTVEVYGNAYGSDVFSEDYTGKLNLSNSRSCYTESKRVSEAMCQSYISEYQLDVKIVRLSRIFGPTMLLSDTKAGSQFIMKAIDNEDIVLKSNGDQYFSYTYVSDAVSAILFVLLHGNVGVAYNISSKACDIHLRDFAQICAEYNGKSVVFDLPSETESKGYSIATQAILDNRQLLNLGFVPYYTMRDAINRTIQILK